jgi:hypothetical protein
MTSPELSTDLDLLEVRDALNQIPRKLEADERYKVYAALKSMEDEDKAIDLIAEWQGLTISDAREKLSTFKQPTKISLGTLFYVAHKYGWTPNTGLESLKKYTPIESYSDRWCRPIPELDGIVAIRSPKGSGKTEQIKVLINAVETCLIPGHRRTLLRQLATRTETQYYRNLKPEEYSTSKKLCITLDSLTKVKVVGSYDLVVIDEVCQVLRHLIGDTVRPDRPNILATLRAILSRSKRIVILDADLTDTECTFISDLANKSVYKIANYYQTPKIDIVVHETLKSILESGAESFGRRLESAKTGGEKTFVACNTKASAKLVAEYYRQFGHRVKLITSDNSKDEFEFLSKLNDGGLDDVDYLVSSPSLSTGIDIQTPMRVLSVSDRFVGLSGSDLCQHLARVRNPISIDAWCDDSTNKLSVSWRALRKSAIEQSVVLLQFNEFGEREVDQQRLGEKEYLDLWAKLTAIHNDSSQNLSDSFYKQLEAEGYKLVNFDNDNDQDQDDEGLDLKTLRNVIRERDDLELIEATDEGDELYEVNARIQKLFGSVDSNTIKEYDDGRILDRLESYQVFLDASLGLAPYIYDWGFASDFPINVAVGVFAWECWSKWLECGCVESSEFKKWTRYQKTRSTILLGSEARGTRLLKNALNKCGLDLAPSKQSRSNGRKRTYNLAGKDWMDEVLANLNKLGDGEIPEGVEW